MRMRATMAARMMDNNDKSGCEGNQDVTYEEENMMVMVFIL